jgi:hypothetical protein
MKRSPTVIDPEALRSAAGKAVGALRFEPKLPSVPKAPKRYATTKVAQKEI